MIYTTQRQWKNTTARWFPYRVEWYEAYRDILTELGKVYEKLLEFGSLQTYINKSLKK